MRCKWKYTDKYVKCLEVPSNEIVKNECIVWEKGKDQEQILDICLFHGGIIVPLIQEKMVFWQVGK